MIVLPLLRENKTPCCPIQRVLENDFVVVTSTGTARDFIRPLIRGLREHGVAAEHIAKVKAIAIANDPTIAAAVNAL